MLVFLFWFVHLASVTGGEGGEGGADESAPPLKRTSSARNVAKLLKKTLTKHNLLSSSVASESAESQTPNQHKQLNGHSPSDHTHTNGHTSTEQDSSTNTDHQAETASPKHSRKKDSCSLATVTEETNGDGETDRLTGDRYSCIDLSWLLMLASYCLDQVFRGINEVEIYNIKKIVYFK